MVKRTPMKQNLHVRPLGNGKALVHADLEWKYASLPDSKNVIGVCPALGITLEADSIEELFSLIPESMEALFKSLGKHGDWDKYLKSMNWTPSEAKAIKPKERTGLFMPPLRLTPVPLHDLEPAACG